MLWLLTTHKRPFRR